MKRLRHPIRAIREPFGTAGLIVACVALVLATTGAAFAAKGALTGKQKKEVEKIAKKFAGKPGAPGAQGPAGPQGAQGPAGANGKDGAQGSQGATGAPGAAGAQGAKGADGKSVEAVPLTPADAECEHRGGAIYEVEGSGEETEICNGEDGAPWTVGGTLPPGQKETGVWATAGIENGPPMVAALPFFIPIPQGSLGAEEVHFALDEDFFDFCIGVAARPAPKPGHLCVYLNSENGGGGLVGIFNASESEPGGPQGAAQTGAFIKFESPQANRTLSGTYGVAAPCASGEEPVAEGLGLFAHWVCQPEA